MQEHMVICKEPYLTMILQGKKKIETRWSQQKRTPFNKVKSGDKLYLKKSGGSVVGDCYVKSVSFFSNMIPTFVEKLIQEWNEFMLIQPDLISKCLLAKYGSFIWIEKIVQYGIKDRFGWKHIGQDKTWE